MLHSSGIYDVGMMDPVRLGATKLLIVSGYATPSMASQLLSDVSGFLKKDIEIELVVGMTGIDGISGEVHSGFESIQLQPPAGKIEILYMPKGKGIHTKLYVWLKDDLPFLAFAGSPNFTHPGFLLGRHLNSRGELLVEISPDEGFAEYQRIKSNAVSIIDSFLFEKVKKKTVKLISSNELNEGSVVIEPISVILPLVMTGKKDPTRRGQIHEKSGLNWGRRKGRDPDQAYIPVPKPIAKIGFFPPRKQQFLVNTDDGKAIIMVVAQDSDKALESPQNNSIIGKYFRERLGVKSGERVTLDDLNLYGASRRG